MVYEAGPTHGVPGPESNERNKREGSRVKTARYPYRHRMSVMKQVDFRRGDLHLLVVFDAIYREGSVSNASQRLHVTQPTLSHSLRRLRELFDDPLFERQGNVMMPTPRARSLIGPIQKGLSLLEASVNQVVPAKPRQVRQKLTIGMNSVDVAGFLPALVARQNDSSDYDIAITRYRLDTFEARLVSGKFDLVIQTFVPHSDAIRHALLTREGLAVVARRGHPSVIAGQISFDAYMSQRHVLISDRDERADVLEASFRQSRLNREVQVRCQDHWTACKIVALTDCLLTATWSTISQVIKNFPELQVVRPPQELWMEPQDVYIYWSAGREVDQANRWLRENLLTIFQERNRDMNQ